jgi:protein gp37
VSDKTKIEWADATVNAINGCSVHSPGCTNCYAMRSGGRNLPNHPSTGLTVETKAGHVWTGEVRLNEKALLQPLKWKRPRRIFWNAHGDLFHENVPDKWIDRMFAVCALTPQHTHMILTKRSDRMRAYFGDLASEGRVMRHYMGYERAINWHWPLANVWLGVSVEDQERKFRIDALRATPAAKRFLSLEPLLEDLGELDLTGIDWVIAGGESGPRARPLHPDWVRSIRDQCASAEVAFLFKQWGEWVPCAFDDVAQHGPVTKIHTFGDGSWVKRIGKKAAGNYLDGVQHLAFPA